MFPATARRLGGRTVSVVIAPPPRKPRKQAGRWRRDIVLLLLMAPALAYFLVFHYGALAGAATAVFEYKPYRGLWASEWVGLDTFQRLLGDPGFWHAFWNTVYIAVLQLVFFFPVPLALAMLLHSLTGSTIKRFVQSVVYLPHFISWVIVVALF